MRPTRSAALLTGALGCAAMLTACEPRSRTALSPLIEPSSTGPAANQTLGTPAEQPPAAAPPLAPPVAVEESDLALPTGDRSTSLLLIQVYNPAEAVAGRPMHTEIRATNLSDRVLENVVVRDRLPASAQISVADSVGSIDRSPEDFRVVQLPPGGPTFQSFAYTPPAINPAAPNVTSTIIPPSQQPSVHAPGGTPRPLGPSVFAPEIDQPQQQPSLLGPLPPPAFATRDEPLTGREGSPAGAAAAPAPSPLLERHFAVAPQPTPQALGYVGGSAGQGTTGSEPQHAAEWALGQLEPRETRTLRVTVIPGATGPLTRCVTATFEPSLCTSTPVRPAR